MDSSFSRALSHNTDKVVEGKDSSLQEQLTKGKSSIEKSKFSTAELRGAKFNFISQYTSHYQTLHSTKGSPSIRETEKCSYKLGKTNMQPFYSKSSSGLSNSIFVKTCLKLCTSHGSNEPGGSFASRSRYSESTEERRNTKRAGEPGPVSKLSICSSKER